MAKEENWRGIQFHGAGWLSAACHGTDSIAFLFPVEERKNIFSELYYKAESHLKTGQGQLLRKAALTSEKPGGPRGTQSARGVTQKLVGFIAASWTWGQLNATLPSLCMPPVHKDVYKEAMPARGNP